MYGYQVTSPAVTLVFHRTPRPVPYVLHHSPECDGLSLLSIVVKPLPRLVGGGGDVIGTTRDVWRCAEAYRHDHPSFVVAAFALVYVMFQTFAIPGPIVLSILSGALYPRCGAAPS